GASDRPERTGGRPGALRRLRHLGGEPAHGWHRAGTHRGRGQPGPGGAVARAGAARRPCGLAPTHGSVDRAAPRPPGDTLSEVTRAVWWNVPGWMATLLYVGAAAGLLVSALTLARRARTVLRGRPIGSAAPFRLGRVVGRVVGDVLSHRRIL